LCDGYVTPNDTTFMHLEGRVYEVPDTNHGTGSMVQLRVVKNDSGAAFTATHMRKCVSFSSTTKNDWGCRVDGLAKTDGELCKPIDDEYYNQNATIPDNDLFYVVESGPVDVLSRTDNLLTAAKQLVSVAGGGGLLDIASDGHYGVGMATEAPASTAASTAFCVFVNAGIANVKTGAAGTAQ
jgi:hypothetical protein